MGVTRSSRGVLNWGKSRYAAVLPGLSAAAIVIALACGGPQASQAPQPEPSVGATQEPGVASATFIRDDCEWSGPEASASCFGNRGAGFRIRAIRREGDRWYIWDPSTNNYAYVSRNALSLPAELTSSEDPLGPAAKAVVSCVDRSNGYRYTTQAREGIAKWIRDSAHPGDLFYERWIEDNSYRPEAEIIPAIRVPAEPTRLPQPASTPAPPNPFNRDQVAQATATIGAMQTVEARASATREALQNAVTNELTQELGALVAAPASPSTDADVTGCVKKASELLQGFDGDRYLLLALNLEDGPPTLPGVKLDRARIRLVFVQCDDPARCDQLKQAWLQVAAAANAADIKFFDPSEGLTGLEKS
jgi:hypothetical protein